MHDWEAYVWQVFSSMSAAPCTTASGRRTRRRGEVRGGRENLGRWQSVHPPLTHPLALSLPQAAARTARLNQGVWGWEVDV